MTQSFGDDPASTGEAGRTSRRFTSATSGAGDARAASDNLQGIDARLVFATSPQGVAATPESVVGSMRGAAGGPA